MNEYAEIMTLKLGKVISESVLSTFDNLDNIDYTTRYYRWHAIKADPDDDKFVDCAVAAVASCIVTEDNHFKVLKNETFPKTKVVNIEEFKNLFDTRTKVI